MSVIDNYKKVIENIKSTCKELNRNYKSINIVAVCKQQNINKIRSLASIGHKSFGENRLKEALEKWTDVDREIAQLHFIGALQ